MLSGTTESGMNENGNCTPIKIIAIFIQNFNYTNIQYMYIYIYICVQNLPFFNRLTILIDLLLLHAT